jgi:hypothetical protein
MAEEPMTKLWYTNLNPPNTISTPKFRQLWSEVLDFCFSASGPTSSGHTLWQDISSQANLVMISGYPSYESNQAADKTYIENGYMRRMAEFLDHRRLLQIDMDVNALMPAGLGHNGGVLCIETFPGAEGEVGEGWIEGVELGKGGDRQKARLRFRVVKGEEVKQELERRTEGLQTMYLRWIM